MHIFTNPASSIDHSTVCEDTVPVKQEFPKERTSKKEEGRTIMSAEEFASKVTEMQWQAAQKAVTEALLKGRTHITLEFVAPPEIEQAFLDAGWKRLTEKVFMLPKKENHDE